MDVLLPGPSASNPFGTPACARCARGVLGLEDETEEEEMSSGAGKLMRRIVELVAAAENRTMTRRRLEEVLVGQEKFDRSNLLRALKSLADRHEVYLREGHSLDASVVSAPGPVPESMRIDDDEILAILEGP